MERHNRPQPLRKLSPSDPYDVPRIAAFVRQVLDDSKQRLERANNLQRRGRRLRSNPQLKAVK